MTNGRDAASRGLDKDSRRSTSQNTSDPRRQSAGEAGDALSKVADAAQQAGSQAKQAAASLASETGESTKDLLNQQMRGGADLARHVAQAVRAAADNLEPNAPLLARTVRGAADNMQEFSQSMRGQTVEEVFGAASDFIRRRPALVFSAAAACGFVLFRLLKTGTTEGARFSGSQRQFGAHGWPLQPSGDEWGHNQGEAAGGISPGNRARHPNASVGR